MPLYKVPLTFLQIYPIGSIYMSVVATSPTTLFGGTWTTLEDRFLIGKSATYTAGATGGEATHALSVDELASHRHLLYGSAGGSNTFPPYTAKDNDNIGAPPPLGYATGTTYEGAGTAHENRPPYLAVYMWKRTA